MKSKIKQRPLHNFLVVKRIAPPTQSKGGVALAGGEQKKQEINFCEVLRTANDLKDIKPGDIVQAKEYSLAPIYGEKEMFVVDFEDLLYVLEK